MLPFSLNRTGVFLDIPDGYAVKYKTGGVFEHPFEAKVLIAGNWELFWKLQLDPVWHPDHVTPMGSLGTELYLTETFFVEPVEQVTPSASLTVSWTGKYSREPEVVESVFVFASLGMSVDEAFTFTVEPLEEVTALASLIAELREKLTFNIENTEEVTPVASLLTNFIGVVGTNHWANEYRDDQVNSNTARLTVNCTSTGRIQILRGTPGNQFNLLDEAINDISTGLDPDDIEVIATNNSSNPPLSNEMNDWVNLTSTRTLIVELPVDGVYTEETWTFTLSVRDKNNFGITNEAQMTLVLSVES